MAPQASSLNPLSNNQQNEFSDRWLNALLTNKDSFRSICQQFPENYDKSRGISICEGDVRSGDS